MFSNRKSWLLDFTTLLNSEGVKPSRHAQQIGFKYLKKLVLVLFNLELKKNYLRGIEKAEVCPVEQRTGGTPCSEVSLTVYMGVTMEFKFNFVCGKIDLILW